MHEREHEFTWFPFNAFCMATMQVLHKHTVPGLPL
jgi:hypothetical protein